MFPQLPLKKPLRSRFARSGLSLVELLMSVAVLAMIAGVIGGLAVTAQSANEYSKGNGTAIQHARVVFDRIDRTIRNSTFNETFPSFKVVSWTLGTENFPDTLVVWLPIGNAMNPTGLPQRNELVVYQWNPTSPGELIELTDRAGPTTSVPAMSDDAGWRTLLTNLASSASATHVSLTTLLRVAEPPTYAPGTLSKRGVIRFREQMAPTAQEIANYRASSGSWSSLSWPLGLYGQTYGVVNRVCYIEMHLVPATESSTSSEVIPFFWSSSINRELAR